ncbi:MAG: IRE (iron responsive element) [Planctomycetota bacterium]
MNNRSLSRKIIYILAMVALLFPLFYLGKPPTKGSGKIAELRSRYSIGQADLGKLDPASESMKLATLGLRGIAATILWLQADHYKEEKFFDRFSATLNQIALLQPHMISVWQHQAHNLSYNVSPEFDDYRQRYEWVKKGIDYLVKGTKFNARKPILQYDLGQYLGAKMGKADEKLQYRELFRNDDEFHKYFVEQGLNAKSDDALGPDRKPDNWLVGKQWFEQAYQLVSAGVPIKKSPHLLFSYGPLWQMYHGEAIEDEGVLDERAKFVWEKASREWKDFGNRELATTGYVPVTLRSLDTARKNVEEVRNKFFERTASVREKVMASKREKFAEANPLKAKAFDKPIDDRTNEERMWASEFQLAIEPTYQELASELPRTEQIEALELASQLRSAEEYARSTGSLREQVNYTYWETRALAEQQQMMVDARRLIFEANKLIDVADIKGAVEKYEDAFVRWDKVFRYYPVIMTEDVGGDVLKAINRYKKLIDEDIDERFVLYEFMQFRRAYDADYLDFNIEKTLADWNADALKLGSPEDFFNTPLAKAYGIKGEDSQPSPGVTPSPGANKVITPRDLIPAVEAPMPENPKSGEASVKGTELQLEKSNLPPTLENPGQ